MLRADLQCPRRSMRCEKFVTGMAVINREHVTTIEFARYVVDPVECCEVYFGLVILGAHGQFLQMIAQRLIRNRLIDKSEHVPVKVYKFFEPCAGLRELGSGKAAEERAEGDICEIISAASNRAPARGIISILGMIKRLLHEPGEGNRAAGFDFGTNTFDQSVIADAHLVISLS